MERTNHYPHTINEYVSYRHNGIYKIADICKKEFAKNSARDYYVLQSVYEAGTKIYVPADTDEASSIMKRVLSADEINFIINKTEELNCEWIDDNAERDTKFNKILDKGKRSEILWLVKLLSIQKEKLLKQKKKLYSSDERILNTAERIITEEFAFVLGLKKAEVIPYIISQR